MSIRASCAPDETKEGLLADVKTWLAEPVGSATMKP
jgi:hypothetical protein